VCVGGGGGGVRAPFNQGHQRIGGPNPLISMTMLNPCTDGVGFQPEVPPLFYVGNKGERERMTSL
jgi:hypothetical protein